MLEEKLGLSRIARSTGRPRTAALFGALKLEKLAMGLVICFIMIVAAFNIVGMLTMVVADKTREIGILQAMGLRRRAIGRIFLARARSSARWAWPSGSALGLVVAFVVDRSGWIRINPAIYFIDRLPVHIESLGLGRGHRGRLSAGAGGHALPVLGGHPARRRSRRSGTNEHRPARPAGCGKTYRGRRRLADRSARRRRPERLPG